MKTIRILEISGYRRRSVHKNKLKHMPNATTESACASVTTKQFAMFIFNVLDCG